MGGTTVGGSSHQFGQSWEFMDGQESGFASGLSLGKLGVKITPPHPPTPRIPRLKSSQPWPLGFGEGSFRADYTLHRALFCVTLLGP